MLQAFQDAGQDAVVECVLIGAMAKGLHEVARATEDADLLVRTDKENIERIPAALRAACPEDPFVQKIQGDDLFQGLAVARYCSQIESTILTLLLEWAS